MKILKLYICSPQVFWWFIYGCWFKKWLKTTGLDVSYVQQALYLPFSRQVSEIISSLAHIHTHEHTHTYIARVHLTSRLLTNWKPLSIRLDLIWYIWLLSTADLIIKYSWQIINWHSCHKNQDYIIETDYKILQSRIYSVWKYVCVQMTYLNCELFICALCLLALPALYPGSPEL